MGDAGKSDDIKSVLNVEIYPWTNFRGDRTPSSPERRFGPQSSNIIHSCLDTKGRYKGATGDFGAAFAGISEKGPSTSRGCVLASSRREHYFVLFYFVIILIVYYDRIEESCFF
jgi:hypothetical protein